MKYLPLIWSGLWRKPGRTILIFLQVSVAFALFGVLLARALFHRMAVSPFGFSFLLDVTPGLAVIGVLWALTMGLIGGLLPALRAARVPVTTALRST